MKRFSDEYMRKIFRKYKLCKNCLKESAQQTILALTESKNKTLRKMAGLKEADKSTSPFKIDIFDISVNKRRPISEACRLLNLGMESIFRSIRYQPYRNSAYYVNYIEQLLPDFRINFRYEDETSNNKFIYMNKKFNSITDSDFSKVFKTFILELFPTIYKNVKLTLYNALKIDKNEFDISFYKLISKRHEFDNVYRSTDIINYFYNPCIMFTSDSNSFHFQSRDFINTKKLVNGIMGVTIFPYKNQIFAVKNSGTRFIASFNSLNDPINFKEIGINEEVKDINLTLQNFFADGYIPQYLTVANLFNNLIIEIQHKETGRCMHIQQPVFNRPRLLLKVRDEMNAHIFNKVRFKDNDEIETLTRDITTSKNELASQILKLQDGENEVRSDLIKVVDTDISFKMIREMAFDSNGSITSPKYKILNYSNKHLSNITCNVQFGQNVHSLDCIKRIIQRYKPDNNLPLPFEFTLETRLRSSYHELDISDKLSLVIYKDWKKFKNIAFKTLDKDNFEKLKGKVDFTREQEVYNEINKSLENNQQAAYVLIALHVNSNYRYSIFLRDMVYRNIIIPTLVSIIKNNVHILDLNSKYDIQNFILASKKYNQNVYKLRKYKESFLNIPFDKSFDEFNTFMTEIIYKNASFFNPDYILIKL